MLALDPPPGDATIGGVVATGDSGPLRHRYGGARDLILGMTVALSDGSVARSGGKVIKNVAGYDLGKLFAGSYGTLGTIVEVVVRLHPRPRASVTVVGRRRSGRAGRAAARLSRAPLELDALDVAWSGARDGSRALERRRGRGPRGAHRRLAEGLGRAWSTRTPRSSGRGSARASAARSCACPRPPPRSTACSRRRSGAARRRVALGRRRHAAGPTPTRRSACPSCAATSRPSPCVLLDAPPELRELDPWGVDDGPCSRSSPGEGALRPGRDLQPRRLRGRDLMHGVRRPAPAERRRSTPASTAASACRPARPTRSGARRWTRRAGASSSWTRRARGGRDLGRDGDPLGPLPRLHGLRHRVPVGRAVRPADRGHAAPGRAQLTGAAARGSPGGSRSYVHAPGTAAGRRALAWLAGLLGARRLGRSAARRAPASRASC